MNKTTLIIIIIAIIVIAGLGIIYFLPQFNNGMNYYPNTNTNQSSNNPPVNNPSNQPSGTGTTTTPQTYNITIKNFAFDPATLNIKVGDTVTWINQDIAPHRPNGTIFHSNVINPGQSFSFTFNAAGTYDYICLIHTYMKGRIIVQ